MVNLLIENGNMQLEINREATERAGLRISSRVLRLARIVGSAS